MKTAAGFTIITSLLLSLPGIADACPRTTPARSALPLGIASTDQSKITFSLSRAGKLSIRRTLTAGVPAEAVSCSVVLEGRYSRKLSYSATKTLATRSSLRPVITFSAKDLPSVRPDKFRRQTIQPTLHVRVKTNCVDKDGNSNFLDVTPVVARYAECGATQNPVSMQKFVTTLIRRLRA